MAICEKCLDCTNDTAEMIHINDTLICEECFEKIKKATQPLLDILDISFEDLLSNYNYKKITPQELFEGQLEDKKELEREDRRC
jgi:hypothetical protein